jgi:hypothetical protein
MLRFIMQHGQPDDWSAVAVSVPSALPQREAFEMLARALASSGVGGNAANIAQAISLTKHPEAETALRRHLVIVWGNQALWEPDAFLNWIACDATTCIANLIELGAQPGDFEEQVRQLSEHVCSRNRDSCRQYLAKHYSWLK